MTAQRDVVLASELRSHHPDVFRRRGRTWSMSVDHSAPLPLGFVVGLNRALEMRTAKPSVWTYTALSEVFRIYHGIDRSPSWWMRELRKVGVAPRPRGPGVPLVRSA